MGKLLLLALILVSAAGCSDVTKFSLVSAPQLSNLLGQTSTLEGQLIVALQNQDGFLNFVSYGRYGCGDPNDTKQRQLLNAKDPAALIKAQKVNQAWQTSIDFISAYVKALNKIVGDNTTDLSDVASLTSVASFVASNVPGFPAGTSAAASAFQKATDDIITAINSGRLTQAAQMMEPQLEGAVANIKKYYPVFTGPERLAFQKWDSCALETLAFLRDDPTGKLISKSYPPYFNVDGGVELQTAYYAYITQRNQYRSTPAIADLLQKIIDENKKIAQPNLDLTSVQATAQEAVTIYKDGMAAIAASKNVNKPPAKTGT